LSGPDKFSRFDRAILPHLDAAYNLADNELLSFNKKGRGVGFSK
jgi:hypothetical protein